MIDDAFDSVNTDLAVVPAYGTPEAAIVQPERHAPLSLYAVHRWLPKLGCQRLALVLVLRALAFDAPTTSDGTRRITVSREALAQATGVANAGTVGEWLRSEPILGGGGWRRIARTCPEAEALSRFLPRLRYAYAGKVRTGLVVCVRMDDPLAPEDEPLAERIRIGQQTAGASQLAFTSVPSADDGGPGKAAFQPSEATLKGDNPSSVPGAKTAIPFSGATERVARQEPMPAWPAGEPLLAALKAAQPLSVAAREAVDPLSAAAGEVAIPSSGPASGALTPIAPQSAPLKAVSPPVNVNDNEIDLSGNGKALTDSGDVFAEVVGLVPRGLLRTADVRRALAPLVSQTGRALGDDSSDAFFTKAYVTLYWAGRLDLALRALQDALDSHAERPGAVFTATLKRLCAQEGVALGLKGEKASASVGTEERAEEGEAAADEPVAAYRQRRPASQEEAAGMQLWQEARGELEASMARPIYDTWLRNCEFVSVTWQDPAVVVLAFPPQTAREWVSHRLRASVERALSRVTGRATTIECVLSEPARAAEGR
ncbi:MAG: DnaA N-terminal domain-containing protein [Anaerolineae bacterium]